MIDSTLPIRALHVCSISPATGQTGYEIRVIEEVRLLRQQDIKTAILCFVRRDQLFPLGRLLTLYRRLRKTTGARVFIIPTGHFFDIQFPPRGDSWITWAISFFARLQRARIIHGQALYSTMHILRMRPKLNARVVFEVHGASPEETEMSGGGSNRVNKLEEWEQEALRSADHFNFVSKAMYKHFQQKYKLDVANYSVVPCCVHTEKYSIIWEERERKRQQLDVRNRFVITYLGTLTVWQWPEAIFTLFEWILKHKPEAYFYLLVPKSDHKKAQEFIRRHNIPADSFRLEEIPHDQVGSVLSVADAGLLLRKRHPVNEVASPTKFGEYLAAGVPVIATDGIGDSSEIVKNKRVGIIISFNDHDDDKTDYSSLIDFINSVSQDRMDWHHRCSQIAKEILDWNNATDTLINVYKNIV